MRIFFLFILLPLFTSGFSQKIDYDEIRYVYLVRPANDDDTLSLRRTIMNLNTIDTTQIRWHIDHYYTDLGNAYWYLAHGINKNKYYKYAINAFNSALFHRRNNY